MTTSHLIVNLCPKSPQSSINTDSESSGIDRMWQFIHIQRQIVHTGEKHYQLIIHSNRHCTLRYIMGGDERYLEPWVLGCKIQPLDKRLVKNATLRESGWYTLNLDICGHFRFFHDWLRNHCSFWPFHVTSMTAVNNIDEIMIPQTLKTI